MPTFFYANTALADLNCDHVGRISIDILPDEIVLYIFNFCARKVVPEPSAHGFRLPCDRKPGWRTLVHVCRRWRSIVFAVPRSLGVRLVCSGDTPVEQVLDTWPESLPISIDVSYGGRGDERNVLRALKCKDRVREIDVRTKTKSTMERFVEAMEAPFEELTHLSLCSYNETPRPLPDSFLGGSAPHLRSFSLDGMSFPLLPRLLLSAADLVCLSLGDLYPFEDLSPQLVVDWLCTLTKLQSLKIYLSSRSGTEKQLPVYPLPATRTIHPALTSFAFMGKGEFLDHVFAHVDAPLLKYVDMRLFDSPVLDAPRLAQFIGRTEPREAFNQAHMLFCQGFVDITFSSQESTSSIGSGDGYTVQVKILTKYINSHWRVWILTQGLRTSFPPKCEPEYRRRGPFEAWPALPGDVPDWAMLLRNQVDVNLFLWAEKMENAEWLRLFALFPAVENLYLSGGVARYVTRALQEADGENEAAKVFPALKRLFIEGLQPSGPVRKDIGKFGSARKASSCPVTIQRWEIGSLANGRSWYA